MYSSQKLLLKNQQFNKDSKKPQRTRFRKQKNSNPPIFISKTYQILQNNDHKQVISWNEQGTNFVIIDVEKFQQEVLPVHFRHRNFSSFVRQLNMYDFHKIRNDHNKNIFEHKQFKRDHRQCLRNIKRKGCTGKKSLETEENMSVDDHEEMVDFMEETPRIEIHEDKYNRTIESIERIGHESPIASIHMIHFPVSPSPQKRRKMEEFLSSLPAIIESESEIQLLINELRGDPQYQCISSKKDIRKLIAKLLKKMPKRQDQDELQQLSIEEQIIADHIDRDHLMIANPTLAVLATEKFLPKSINLIGSMHFCDDAEHLFYQKLY